MIFDDDTKEHHLFDPPSAKSLGERLLKCVRDYEYIESQTKQDGPGDGTSIGESCGIKLT